MSSESFTVEGKKLDEKGRLVPVDLTIDASKVVEHVKKVEEENEELRSERDSLKSTLQLVAEKAFAKKKESLGCFDENITSPSQLMAWEAGHKARQGTVAGTAPLYGQGQQEPPEVEGEGFSQGFENMGEMAKWLHAKEGTGSSKAKQILDEFTRRSLKSIKEQPSKTVTYVQQGSLKDEINARFRLKNKLAREAREGEVNE